VTPARPCCIDESMLVEMSSGPTGHLGLESLFERSPGFMAVLEGLDYKIALANDAFVDLVGPIGKSLPETLPGFTGEGIDKIIDGASRTGEVVSRRGLTLSVLRADGSTEKVLVDIAFYPLASCDGQPPGIFIHGNNVGDDGRSQALRTAHNKVLELAISNAPLETSLTELIRMVESASSTGVLGSILLLDLDGKHLRLGAAPSLPLEYSAVIDGAEVGDFRGSCGTAAYLGAAVFVSDIATDPLWAQFKQFPLAHGLRACWSVPILTRNRTVLGTFAMYHREPREPTARDLMLVDLITQTAALIIDRERTKAALQDLVTADHHSLDGSALARESAEHSRLRP
jgi:hypothetical protein